MYFGMSLTMNELFNYEHPQSIKGCTPEKKTFKSRQAWVQWLENKVSLKLKLLQTLRNTTGLILRNVTKNQQVYPTGKEKRIRVSFLS